ncbi:MAG: L-fucose mutarotase [Rhodothermales bacterium]|jgi:L-fucose mutarotase
MLFTKLIHPKILEVLARAGHHGRVLIADGNYPASSTLGPNAELVSLNLSPGIPTCTQVLEALVATVPFEAAYTMDYQRSGPYALDADPPVWDQYRGVFAESKLDIQLQPVEKYEFYAYVRTPDHVLTIQTADQGLFANLILDIGVRQA